MRKISVSHILIFVRTWLLRPKALDLCSKGLGFKTVYKQCRFFVRASMTDVCFMDVRLPAWCGVHDKL